MNTNRILTVAGCFIGIIITWSVLPGGPLLSMFCMVLFGVGIYNAYLIYKHNREKESMRYNFNSDFKTTFQPPKPMNRYNNPQKFKYVLIGTVIAMVVLSRVMAPVAYFFFTVGDNLNFTYTASPYIIWSVFGVFIGAVYGGFVAYKKFRLKFLYVLYPFMALVLLITILVIHQIYFKSHDYLL